MTAEEEFAGLLARYAPEIAERTEAVLARLRERLPGAVELVYDNYNALVIGFGPSERASDATLSVAVYPRWVRQMRAWNPDRPRRTVVKSVSARQRPRR